MATPAGRPPARGWISAAHAPRVTACGLPPPRLAAHRADLPHLPGRQRASGIHRSACAGRRLVRWVAGAHPAPRACARCNPATAPSPRLRRDPLRTPCVERARVGADRPLRHAGALGRLQTSANVCSRPHDPTVFVRGGGASRGAAAGGGACRRGFLHVGTTPGACGGRSPATPSPGCRRARCRGGAAIRRGGHWSRARRPMPPTACARWALARVGGTPAPPSAVPDVPDLPDGCEGPAASRGRVRERSEEVVAQPVEQRLAARRGQHADVEGQRGAAGLVMRQDGTLARSPDPGLGLEC